MHALVSSSNEVACNPLCCSESTGLATSSSGGYTSCDESSSVALSLPVSDQQGRRKSVRFSLVHTREYETVDEHMMAGNDEDGALCHKFWSSYVEKQSHLETHISETTRKRKENY
mmetsp:Transcript_34853/g.74292  ORF Transcript_34853/g.74292 Transcript_34853/m.74292 type:complete len:115 (+) Transcript_34853:91-435(+)